jgi:anaerobic selenocysteine-containing dehydrogenase
MTRTGKIQRLASQAIAPYIEINPDDAQEQNISDGEMVQVSSTRGQVTITAKISSRLMQGVVFMPFHWGDLYAPGNAANLITNDVVDPVSKEPEYKACAVAIAKTVDSLGSGSLTTHDNLFMARRHSNVGAG